MIHLFSTRQKRRLKIIGACFLAFILVLQSNFVHQLVCGIVSRETSKVFKQRVTIEKISGNLLFSATLHHLRFYNKPGFAPGTVLDIEEATAHYNPIKALLFRGDFAKASYSVRVKRATVAVHRDQRDLWNVLMILPPPVEGAPPPTFTGKLWFDNLTITFKDELGWGGKPTTFRDNYGHFQGLMDFGNLTHVSIDLIGRHTQQPNQGLKITGHMNAVNGQYDLTFVGSQLPLATWGNYVFDRQGFLFHNGIASIVGRIRSKPVYVPQLVPFWYDVVMDIHDATFKLPFFTKPIDHLTAKSRLRHWPVAQELQPATELSISRSDGHILGTPVTCVGLITLNTQQFALDVTAAPATLDTIWQAIPAFSNTPLKGVPRDVSAHISGHFEAPIVSGNMTLSTATLYGVDAKEVSLSYGFERHKLAFQLRDGIWRGGHISGQGTIALTSSPPHIEFSGLSQGTRMEGLSSTENYTLAVMGHGAPGDFETAATLNSTTAVWYGQQIRHGVAKVSFNGDKIQIAPSYVFINQSTKPIQFSGLTTSANTLQILAKGANIPLRDIDISSSDYSPGIVSFVASANVSIAKAGRLSDYSGGVVGNMTNATLLGQSFSTTNFAFTVTPTQLLVSKLDAVGLESSFFCEGRFLRTPVFVPDEVTVRLRGIDPTKSRIIDRLTPDALHPFSGKLSFDGQLVKSTFRVEPGIVDTRSFLSSINLNGLLTLEDGKIQNQNVDYLDIDGSWNGRHVIIRNSHLKTGESVIDMAGVWSPDVWDLNIKPSTHFRMSDFPYWLNRFGKLDGLTTLQGTFKKDKDGHHVLCEFAIDKFKGTTLELDAVSGQLSFDNHLLRLSPLTFTRDSDKLAVIGQVYIPPTSKSKALSQISYALRFDTSHLKVSTLSDVIQSLEKEIFYRNLDSTPAHNSGLTTDSLTIQMPKSPTLSASIYTYFGQKESALGHFLSSTQRLTPEVDSYFKLQDVMNGILSGTLQLQSRRRLPPLVSGNIALDKANFLFVSANRFVLNLQSYQNVTDVSFFATKGLWDNTPFTQIGLFGQVTDAGIFQFKKSYIDLGQVRYPDILSGQISLINYNTAPLDLRIFLDKNTLALLAPMSPIFYSFSNEGHVSFLLGGTLANPVLNAPSIVLTNASILFNPELTSIVSPVRITSANIDVINNVVNCHHLDLLWQGPDTLRYNQPSVQATNKLSLNGLLKLKELTFVNPKRMLLVSQFWLEDTTLNIYFPRLFKGELLLSKMYLQGEFPIPFRSEYKTELSRSLLRDNEEGPVLSGSMVLSNGEIVMPTLTTRPPKPSILLNLDVAVGPDLHVSGSLIDQDFFNTFELDLAKSTAPFKLLGSLNYPKPQQPLTFSDGTVRIFNRTFSLLSPSTQRIYLPSQHYNGIPNQISFSVLQNRDSQRLRVTPILQTTALSVIDPDPVEFVTGNIAVDPNAGKYRHVLVKIDGPVYDLASFIFYQFTSDFADPKDKQVAYVGSADMADQASASRAFEILLPDLYYSASQNKFGNRSSRILSQFGEYEINSILRRQVRPIEKNIARNIGLHDIRVDYNLGGALLKPTGVSRGLPQNTQNVGVNFFQNFFSNQLYMRVKTDLDTQRRSTNGISLSEFEMTYLLSSNLSTSYISYRDDSSLNSIVRDKWSLKYRYEY